MRQGQQNRRGRGRNRKGQNPLTRSFESNGPDMKIRGTPAHIAEKYISLARDALSSGDPVLAENYLQHAEHYNRIIMSFREQQAQPGIESQNGTGNRHRTPQNGGAEAGESGAEGELVELGTDDQHQDASSSEQPQNGRANNDRGSRGRGDGNQRERRGRSQNSNRQNGRQNASRDQNRESNSARRSSSDREGFGSDDSQPEFLKRPVRRSRRDEESSSKEAEVVADSVAAEDSQD